MAASWRFTGIGQPEFTAPEVSQADEYTKTRESDLFRELLLFNSFTFSLLTKVFYADKVLLLIIFLLAFFSFYFCRNLSYTVR